MKAVEAVLHYAVSRHWIYDAVQRALGCEHSLSRLNALVPDLQGKSVLDIGGGTGNGARIVPATARYFWLDNDVQKLKGLRARFPASIAALGDARLIPLKDKSVDVALCLAVAHHLDDEAIRVLLCEVSRVCREHLIFLDPVDFPSSRSSRWLWKYDRGSHPRSSVELRCRIEEEFEIRRVVNYSIYHHYFLCLGIPRVRSRSEDPLRSAKRS